MVVKDYHFLKYGIMLHIMVVKDFHLIINVTSYVLKFFCISEGIRPIAELGIYLWEGHI